MKKPLSRIEFVAKKLGKLNEHIILDLGCRDMSLKNYLDGNFNYIGLDYSEEKEANSNFINHNLENGLPKDLKQVDTIVALDVLEHVENIHEVYNELFSASKKTVIIALPNMAYYKFRINFLIKGVLSGKYIFSTHKVIDRHRWIPNYSSIDKFVEINTPKNWRVTEYNYIAQRKRNFLFDYLEKILSNFFPRLFVYEKIFFISKISN